MEDKPKMYQNKTKKEFHNNRTIFNGTTDKYIYPKKDIKKKITNILNSNSFIYSKTVNLIINGSHITKKIIGLSNNNLVTIDNEYIPIDNIDDIS